MSAVFATVGVPPKTLTAPPLTRIFPAALRLMVILLSRLSPNTLKTPAVGKNVAVTAGKMRSCKDSTLGVKPCACGRRKVRGLSAYQRRTYLKKRRNINELPRSEREKTPTVST